MHFRSSRRPALVHPEINAKQENMMISCGHQLISAVISRLVIFSDFKKESRCVDQLNTPFLERIQRDLRNRVNFVHLEILPLQAFALTFFYLF